MECTLSNFTDDTELAVFDVVVLQQFDRLVRLTERNLMKFSEGPCKALHLENNPVCQHRLGRGFLVGTQHCRESSRCPGTGVEHKPALRSHSRGDQQQPGLQWH